MINTASPSLTSSGVTPALEMRNIKKTYPGVVALKGVSLNVLPGECHALLGENGAGKSTLMKILAGATKADSGEIVLRGQPVEIASPQHAMSLGIAIVYQEFNLVPTLTAGENIFLGREPKGMLGSVNFGTLYAEAQRVLDSLGVRLSARTFAGNLSVAQQQMVEIAKAITQKARIIVMDEPTAALTDHEINALFGLIRRLKADGVSVIYISHRLEEVFAVCDRATVMRDGGHISTQNVADLTREEIIRLMVGRELGDAIPKETAKTGELALRVKNLSRGKAVQNVSFEIRQGEIVGLAGLVGAGRTEVARLIFGADAKDSGTLEIFGEPVEIRAPQDAIRYGIGFVTEDRKEQGLILERTVRENTTLAGLARVSSGPFIVRGKEREVSQNYVRDLATKTPSVEQAARNLSGGNQQKVVLAKWLLTNPRILIFDEPTRGIDVGAKSEIYRLMNRLASEGIAVLMISSELPELLGMSDRVLVMHEGKLTGELSRSEATQERVMHLATGGQ